MTLLKLYQQAVDSGKFYPDDGQHLIIEQLQKISDAWVARHLARFGWLENLLSIAHYNYPVQGLYLWGGVGAGKTWLMNLFYDSLLTKNKMRLHFHRFMQQVHLGLKQRQGQKDPLNAIAKEFSQQAKLIFLDEFIVNDITDAMLLANLLEALFAAGVTLMATSNNPPENLYRNGLQRNRFLPAISLIKTHMHIMQAAVLQDYRLRDLAQAGVYFYPLDQFAEQQLLTHYQHLANSVGEPNKVVMIAGRPIKSRWYEDKVIWFDFDELCQVPRSQLDYLEIARIYPTVILSNVPQISSEQDNRVIYLINLIDIFYDAKVKLIISAAVSVQDLYLKGRYSFEFKRTVSRLLEMQSNDYLCCLHLG